MRIIGGSLKGKKLFQPIDQDTRPLKDIVKESIFNILQHSVDNKVNLFNSNVLDLFSGTGSFGLECLSRGARKVVFIERQKRLCQNLEEVLKKLKIEDKCRIINTNATSFDFRILKEKFDLIFLDPPFRENLSQRSFDMIHEYDLLVEKGFVYLECEKDLDIQKLETPLAKIKASEGGETKYYLFEG